jgi:hypothetical protein
LDLVAVGRTARSVGAGEEGGRGGRGGEEAIAAVDATMR